MRALDRGINQLRHYNLAGASYGVLLEKSEMIEDNLRKIKLRASNKQLDMAVFDEDCVIDSEGEFFNIKKIKEISQWN